LEKFGIKGLKNIVYASLLSSICICISLTIGAGNKN